MILGVVIKIAMYTVYILFDAPSIAIVSIFLNVAKFCM